jgi:hypothetical protein
VVFLLFSRASAPHHDPGIYAAGLLLVLGVGLAMIARLVPGGRVGSFLSGMTSGGCLGVAVVAVAIPISRFKADGLLDTLTDWSPYVAAVVGLLATAATQQAYTRGELAWSLPALTVADPLTATVLSVIVLRENLDPSMTAIWASGAGVASVGVALSAMSRASRAITSPPAARAPSAPRS